MHIFASLAEFERDLIIERTQAGRKAAMARGKKMGRPKLKRNKRARAAAIICQRYGNRRYTKSTKYKVQVNGISISPLRRHRAK